MVDIFVTSVFHLKICDFSYVFFKQTVQGTNTIVFKAEVYQRKILTHRQNSMIYLRSFEALN